MFMWGGYASRSNPLPFIYHFSCKRQPFHIPSLPQENATIIALFSVCRFMPVMDGTIHCLNKKGQMVSFLSLLTKTKLQTVIMTSWLTQYCYSAHGFPKTPQPPWTSFRSFHFPFGDSNNDYLQIFYEELISHNCFNLYDQSSLFYTAGNFLWYTNQSPRNNERLLQGFVLSKVNYVKSYNRS